jgi:hypothetical protein
MSRWFIKNKVKCALCGVAVVFTAGGFFVHWKSLDNSAKEGVSLQEVREGDVSRISDGQDVRNKDADHTEQSNSEEAVQNKADQVVKRTTPIMQQVPFTSQAPTGNWKESMFQDGCEEASMFMAVKWLKHDNSKFSSVDTVQKMQALTDWEKKRFGYAVDLAPEDVARALREFFEVSEERVVVKTAVSKDDLIDALYKGAIVIVPADGKALRNPNFTAGGPDRHMLVIVGYDPETKQFVTNDPGTRKGEGYRYDEDVLYSAIRAYKTGDHEPIVGTRKAAVAVRGRLI